MSSALGHFITGLYGKVTILKAANDAHSGDVSGGVHGAVSAATNNMIIRRDASGRADITPPAASDDSSKIPSTAWVQTEIAGGGTVTSVGSGTGLTGGPITGSGSLSIDTTGVSAGSYTLANITVNAQGQLTAASDGSAAVTNVTGTSPITSTGGQTPAIAIPAATGSVNGYMSSSDKTKLDNIDSNATDGPIDTVFGRTGAVVSQLNDIEFSDLDGVTLSTGAPSGGADGDIHFQHEA